MSSRDLYDFRAALKTGKRYLSQGDANTAERHLLRALEFTDYFEDTSVKNEKRAFVLHRLAEVSILQDDPMNAKRRFKEALKLINPRNKMGHARLLRDYGNFERVQGRTAIGRKHVNQALSILKSMSITDRVKKETLVTKGFVARFDLNDPLLRDAAIEVLRSVARELYGYKKKAYELANLRCLIDVLHRRPAYLQHRARQLHPASGSTERATLELPKSWRVRVTAWGQALKRYLQFHSALTDFPLLR